MPYEPITLEELREAIQDIADRMNSLHGDTDKKVVDRFEEMADIARRVDVVARVLRAWDVDLVSQETYTKNENPKDAMGRAWITRRHC